jgi:hypothetical protein
MTIFKTDDLNPRENFPSPPKTMKPLSGIFTVPI